MGLGYEGGYTSEKYVSLHKLIKIFCCSNVHGDSPYFDTINFFVVIVIKKCEI